MGNAVSNLVCKPCKPTLGGESGTLPYEGLRVVELGTLLTGRLVAHMFADQGAEVIVLADHDAQDSKTKEFNDATNEYLNRGKIGGLRGSISAADLSSLTNSADLVIVDGEMEFACSEKQILLRVCAALPGDAKWGHLPHDCDDDYLSALVGFYTDMASSNFLDREVIYTPLRLCSIYAGVIGAVGSAAALLDRERSGKGREIHTSRLAGGLAAIGALSLTMDGPGVPKYLVSAPASYKRQGLDTNEFNKIRKEAIADPLKQLWLEQRLYPFATPYATKDGSLFLPMATFNARIARTLVDHLGIWPKLEAGGMVDKTPYLVDNYEYRFHNLQLPMNFTWQMGCMVADELERVFTGKTAIEWENELCSLKIACAQVMSFPEWFADDETRAAKIVAEVEFEDGSKSWQLGRTQWLSSASPYPVLKQMKNAGVDSAVLLETMLKTKIQPGPQIGGDRAKDSARPLEGYVVVDFSNVLAGPACGRMFAELGATVYKVGPKLPFHSPMVMVTWQAEENIGKRSIMIDMKTKAGQKVMHQLLEKSDIVLDNKMDAQLEHLGISREALNKISSRLVQLQFTARRGENACVKTSQYPGYDPALQGKTGIMTRFGPPGCPTFHGVASCVDYLGGYNCCFAGVTALYARETKGVLSECAGSSLAVTASLVQCNMQGGEPDAWAQGPWARGRSPLNRIYQIASSPDWIYVQGTRPLAEEASKAESRDAFITSLKKEGMLAVPVYTCKQFAELSKKGDSKTCTFRKREAEGLITETWKPTWLCFDGQYADPAPAAPSGVHAPKILAEVLNYEKDDILKLYSEGVLLPIYWDKGYLPEEWCIWAGQSQSLQRSKLDTATYEPNPSHLIATKKET